MILSALKSCQCPKNSDREPSESFQPCWFLLINLLIGSIYGTGPPFILIMYNARHWVKYMQDYETSQDNANSLEDESGSKNQLGEFIRTLLKKLVVFVCFGPGVLGVLWLFGRLFKR